MAKDRKKLVHIHSKITDKQPRPEALKVGEIAVNNGVSGSTDRSFLSIKNANDKVVRFSSDEQMIFWTEKKEVIPFEGQVRGEDGPESTKDSGDYGSYGITNDDLLNNKSNLVIKFNQVAASNTPKSEKINGGKDIYGKLVNGTLDASREGAGIAVDMSRYAMRGANPSFSSLTITNGTTLEGNLNVSGNTKIGNGLNVTGATNISGATKITGNTTVNGNETVNGNLVVTGNTSMSGNTTIKGSTNISGNTTIDKNLTVNGDTKLQKLSATTANVTNLYATNNISGSSLTATTISATTISGTNANITNLTANTISGGTLNVSGNTTLNNVTANTISASSISAVSISASNIYTKTEINNIENDQNSKINEISGKTNNLITEVQTLSGEVQTISGESVTSGEVQTMIDEAVSGYPDKAEYNSTDKKIYFKHGDTILTSMTISADAFIKDGMIESVEVVPSGDTSYLKIVWNLDGSSGSTKDTIYLNIGDLFEADNYFTRDQLTGTTNYVTVRKAYSANTASTVALSGVTNADDLKAIEALTGTSGLLKKTAANSWTLDTTSYQNKLTASRAIDIANDVISLDLPISAGTGTNSIIEGIFTQASGNYSHAEGGGTIASGSYSHAEGDDTQASGDYSHAEGENTKANGESSHAEGQNTTANGNNSHAEGTATTAIGSQSHAEGSDTIANGESSHAEGSGTTASGVCSHAEGSGTTASGASSHAEGSRTKARGSYSHAEGYNTTASGYASHAEGEETRASGAYSHAEGYITIASGYASHAEGFDTTANGGESHAEGAATAAIGSQSHAEGYYTEASGDYSHAEGGGTKASGSCSHAEGYYTETKNESEHASGQYNVSSEASATFGNSGNTLFSVGNGTSASARHNAFEIRQNGDTYLNGKLSISGDVTANAFYATSDERLKENIENVSYTKMANAANVNIKSFNFKSDEKKKTVIGVIAQDVENENLGFIVSTSNDGMKAVDYTGLSLLKIAYLEQKIKEIENIINELKENKQ